MFSTDTDRYSSFETDLRSGLHRIRGALTDLFESVGADPTVPQVVTRSVGINRNLAWKLSKIIGADEPLTTIEHLPGGAGLEIMLKAFTKVGAPTDTTTQVRAAMSAFERTVEEHTGDRATLDLMLGHMLPRHLQIERAESARKHAFLGNSAIWGIQARVRLSGMFIAPNVDDPTMVDLVTLGGLIGYRRLRPGTSWPLLRHYGYQDDGSSFEPEYEPLDPTVDPGSAPLLTNFCTGAQPPIITRIVPGGRQFELGEGPVGNHGRLTSIFGTVARGFASCYRDETNEYGEQMVNWFTPVEAAVIDLIVHRDLPFRMPPTLRVFGRMGPPWGKAIAAREGEPIDLPETIQHLGDGPPVLATPNIPDYANMTAYAFDRLGWDPREFGAYRLLVRYPPIPTMAMLSFPLAEQPDTAPG